MRTYSEAEVTGFFPGKSRELQKNGNIDQEAGSNIFMSTIPKSEWPI